ncbi:hypothetical protein [Curtobacterium caseinilyticum]|uniref:Uncharacterized protein n=1 Tax=Curtobacterium caseinilyticum TaxID=3055137 RepID=A0ABT7TQK3_9MICO|nr:hypothetical protein [Curtobacterium caseinilyticum]MDM7891877.1 hypothetical protein [Curtobacterium caseinilyticum]
MAISSVEASTPRDAPVYLSTSIFFGQWCRIRYDHRGPEEVQHRTPPVGSSAHREPVTSALLEARSQTLLVGLVDAPAQHEWSTVIRGDFDLIVRGPDSTS